MTSGSGLIAASGSNDAAGFLVEFADRVEQQSAAAFREWDIAQHRR